MKILIVGLSETVGGIETLFYGLFSKKRKDFDVSFLCFGKKCAFEDRFLKNNYKIYYLPSRKSSLFKFNGIVKRFFKQNNDFDFIWFNTSSTSMYQIQYFGKKYTRAKIITHSHGTTFEKQTKSPRHFMNLILQKVNYPKVVKNTDYFFCCSLKAGIALFGKKYEKQLVLIKNGIDTNRFKFDLGKRTEIRKDFSIPDETFVVGFVARLSNQKNPLKAISVFESIVRAKPNSLLMVVGEGPLLHDMMKQIEKLSISTKVLFCGFRNDVDSFYSAIDVLLMPSLFEGLPLGGIEAQTAGVPCLLSDQITDEVKQLETTLFLSLGESDEKWASAAISLEKHSRDFNTRAKAYSIIEKSGYTYSKTLETIERTLKNG